MKGHEQTLPPAAGSAVYRICSMTSCALVIGLSVSLAAIMFVEAVAWLNNTLLISPRTRVQFDGSPWFLTAATILVPVAGGLLVGLLLTKLSAEKRPLGPADILQSVQLAVPPPGAKSGLLSTVGAVISLGFGASVGQYGPLVYLGAMMGNLLDRLNLRIPNFAAIAMACGVAAAISTAFNAPIAGMVFAHEVVLRHYSIQAFAPTTVAAATGYVVANVVFEREPLFLVQFSGVQYGHEFVLFGLLGLLAAGVAIGFMRLTLRCASVAASSPLSPVLRPACAGLAVGITALWLPDVLGVGQEALRFATIEGAFQTWELALLVIAKVALTALCIGFGFAGGIFSPALLIGILFGALCWMLVDGAGIVATSGIVAYAICGMMAVTSAVIGAPLTTILIVFELTRNYDLTIAAMVAVVFSNLVSYRIYGRSIFDVQLAAKGIDLSQGRDRARLSKRLVADLLIEDCARCKPGDPMRDVAWPDGSVPWKEIFVLDDDAKPVGIVDARERTGDPSRRVASHMISVPLVFDETTTLAGAMHLLEGFVGDAIPVVDSRSRKFLGVVTETDIIKTYLAATRDLRREENATA